MEIERSKILNEMENKKKRKTPVQKILDSYKISFEELETIYNKIHEIRKNQDIQKRIKRELEYLKNIKKIYKQKRIYIDSIDKYNYINLKKYYDNKINIKIPNLKIDSLTDIEQKSVKPNRIEVLLDTNNNVNTIILDFGKKRIYNTIFINEKMFNKYENSNDSVFVINDKDTIDYLINNVVTLKEIFEVLSVYTETKVNEEYENLKKQEMEMLNREYKTVKQYNQYLMNDERIRNLYLESNQYDFIRKNLYERLRPHSDFEYWYGRYFEKVQPYELHQLIQFLYENYNTIDWYIIF